MTRNPDAPSGINPFSSSKLAPWTANRATESTSNKHEFARAVAFDANSERLAVTVGRKLEKSDFNMDGEERIVFYDLKKNLAGDPLGRAVCIAMVHRVSSQW